MFQDKEPKIGPMVQTPATILDLERNADQGPPGNVDMFDMMADNCPSCGGNCMRVGDWVCYGMCNRCMYEERS